MKLAMISQEREKREREVKKIWNYIQTTGKEVLVDVLLHEPYEGEQPVTKERMQEYYENMIAPILKGLEDSYKEIADEAKDEESLRSK